VEEIYDSRFEHEKNEVEREEDSPSFDLILLIFPVFVVRRLGTKVGLKTLVDQTCWDLLYSTHIYRRDYLELEIFGRFIQEFYDHDDLLFYLYVRSVISKVLHINFKTRWLKFDGPGRQPRSQWMSYREAAHIAKIVFGNDNDDIYKDFILLITPQMIGMRNDAADSRRIDITEYLHLCVVGYHQSQSRRSNHNGLLVPLPGQVVPSCPVPALPNDMRAERPVNSDLDHAGADHDVQLQHASPQYDLRPGREQEYHSSSQHVDGELEHDLCEYPPQRRHDDDRYSTAQDYARADAAYRGLGSAIGNPSSCLPCCVLSCCFANFCVCAWFR
jgi:hypothetical protein